jgi:hypothetical protein
VIEPAPSVHGQLLFVELGEEARRLGRYECCLQRQGYQISAPVSLLAVCEWASERRER